MLVPLSALQHYAFCPRQCALIHNEEVWSENYLTAAGRLMHERVDSGEPEVRKGIRYERTVHVSAPELGITGILDLLEIEQKSGQMRPVEYKHGRSKASDVDRIQLCAQALALEEMRKVAIPYGAIWYGATKRREMVDFDAALRDKTLTTIADTRDLLISGATPKPSYGKHCKACSLQEICEPQLFLTDKSERYVQALFAEE